MGEQDKLYHLGTVVEGTQGWQAAKERLDRLVGLAVKRLGEGIPVVGIPPTPSSSPPGSEHGSTQHPHAGSTKPSRRSSLNRARSLRMTSRRSSRSDATPGRAAAVVMEVVIIITKPVTETRIRSRGRETPVNDLSLVSANASVTDPARADVVALLLADKRSPATRRAYRQAIIHFFGRQPTPEDAQEFAALPTPAVALRLASYKARMITDGVSEATINLRLAAVRSLLKLCYRFGYSQTDGAGLVDGEKVRAYRDTRGIGLAEMRALIAAPGTNTIKGLRDTALLRLLLENALRRAEVVALDIGDLQREQQRLLIIGKGRGTQQEPVTLSSAAVEAIASYIEAGGHGADPGAPLFLNVDHRPSTRGGRLTSDGIYSIVRTYGTLIGVPHLTPHKLRHSAITAFLDVSGGDVRRAQRLSRHVQIQTLMLYDDNRQDLQGEATRLLSGLLDGGG